MSQIHHLYFPKWNIEAMWYNGERVGTEIRETGVEFWFCVAEQYDKG